MKGKLIKTGEHYCLLEGTRLISTTDCPEGTANKLSIHNCQAIERGYDLDELAINEIPYSSSTTLQVQRMRFIHGFQKALEILGDKKFTLEDMMNCWNKALTFQTHKETLGEHIQSLQQTEWDVEVVMECVIGCQNLILNGENSVCCGDKKPKIEDGCLILKRI